jgi:hypothetical protein
MLVSTPTPGIARDRLASTLSFGYGEGLLSEWTLSHRLDLVFQRRLIVPHALVGDLVLHAPRTRWPQVRDLLARLRQWAFAEDDHSCREPHLLALDWGGSEQELILGRREDCDIVLDLPTVSRRHACFIFRGGNWIVQDLESTNGIKVNGLKVGRCRIQPGDIVSVAGLDFTVD